LANAATGSSKNITPKRLTTASKLAGGSGWTWVSPWRNDTPAIPAASARRRAQASIGPETSRPITEPPGVTRALTASATAPFPQPTSSTRSPGPGAAASMIRSPKERVMRS